MRTNKAQCLYNTESEPILLIPYGPPYSSDLAEHNYSHLYAVLSHKSLVPNSYKEYVYKSSRDLNTMKC